MSTDPNAQDEAVPPEAAPAAGDSTDTSPSASPEQIYDEAIIRLAVITEDWRKGRDVLLGG